MENTKGILPLSNVNDLIWPPCPDDERLAWCVFAFRKWSNALLHPFQIRRVKISVAWLVVR